MGGEKNITHIVPDSRSVVTSRGDYLKIFNTYPLTYSYYVKNGQDFVLPLQSSFSSQAMKTLSDSESFVLLKSFGGSIEVQTQKKSERKLGIRQKQYSKLKDEIFCRGLTLYLLEKQFDSKKKTVSWIERESDMQDYTALLESITIQEPESERWRTFLFADEANFAGIYFQAFDDFCTHFGWEFSGRSRRPAKNPVNALLNYGYAILKGKVDDLVLGTGLDPYVGFFHTLRPGRESLSLDLIEPFRSPVVDRIVLDIVSQNLLAEKDFELKRDEVRLSSKAKEMMVKMIHHKLFLGSEAAINEMDSFIQEVLARIQE